VQRKRPCPLRVKSRHSLIAERCPLLTHFDHSAIAFAVLHNAAAMW